MTSEKDMTKRPSSGIKEKEECNILMSDLNDGIFFFFGPE